MESVQWTGPLLLTKISSTDIGIRAWGHSYIHIRHTDANTYPCPYFNGGSDKIAHYNVIMGAIASQITSITVVYSTVYSDADQIKHQSSASLAFVWGLHRGPVNSPHKWPVTRKMFPFDDVIMIEVSVWVNDYVPYKTTDILFVKWAPGSWLEIMQPMKFCTCHGNNLVVKHCCLRKGKSCCDYTSNIPGNFLRIFCLDIS